MFIVLFTGVVLESELIVWSLIGLDICGEPCREESVLASFIGETIPNQNFGKKIVCNELVLFILACDGIVSNQELLDR